MLHAGWPHEYGVYVVPEQAAAAVAEGSADQRYLCMTRALVSVTYRGALIAACAHCCCRRVRSRGALIVWRGTIPR